MILQNLVFPKIGICTEEKLYFRVKRGICNYDYEQNRLILLANASVQFDTYFNSILADRWKKYTVIKNIKIRIAGEGQGVLNVYRYSSYNGKELISSKAITLNTQGETYPVVETEDQIYGIIYYEFNAISDSYIMEGEFCTDTEKVNDVSLGIVITTFKREAYIKRNMKSLSQYLFDKIDDTCLHIFIIDNAQTLGESSSERISVIPNKNYGGAGGYGRGMLENYRLGKYSHVVLCDDDATYEPEAFLRLFNLLSLAKNKELCVGGSMLKLDAPVFMHESGARYSRLEISPNKTMLKLTEFASLARFNIEEYASYHGWWFFCFPITCVEKLGLPLPIFFQIDDMEYSLRLRDHNYQTTDLNGICVWHESFQRKSSTATNYYWARNKMINSFWHEPYLNALSCIKWFDKYLIESLFLYRYDKAHMMLKGLDDVFKGPEFLMNLNPETNHQKLLREQIDKPHDIDKSLINLKLYNRPVRKNKLKKAAMIITFNGMLLPKFLRHKGMVLEPLDNYRTTATFRQESILYVDIERMSGFIVKRSQKEFWRLLLAMVKADLKILTKFSVTRKNFQNSFPKMTSVDFWENYVGNKK